MNPGYKQTEVGVIPEDWKVATLNDVCYPGGLVRGPFGGALKKEYFVKHGYKVYEQRNAIYGTIELGSYFVDTDKYRELARFRVNPGDFIVSCSGTIGRILQIPQNAPEGIINQALLKITIDPSIINSQFFQSVFQWSPFQDSIIDNSHGGAMQNLVGMDIFRNIPLQLPPMQEQKAIAEVLGDVDDLLASLDRLIAKKRAVKLATMQQLLTGEKRLVGWNGRWEEVRLGEISDLLKGRGLSKSVLSESGQNKCILYGELFTKYDRIIDNVLSNTNSTDGIKSKSGDILMPGSTTTTGEDLATASALLVNDVLLGGDINIIRAKSKSYNSVFLAYYLTFICKPAITELAQGITIIHLYGRNLAGLELKLPAIEEQDAIATVLSDMDAEIGALQARRDKTAAIKQGMMQQLLTGETRLV